ncbi:MAG: hypothetical protein AAGU05_07125 [Anaerolineaceae bacterium]
MNKFDAEVTKFQKAGWILVSKTETTAQLMKMRRGFSCLPYILFAVISIVGFFVVNANTNLGMILILSGAFLQLVQVVWWIFHRKKLMVLTVDEQGNIEKSIRSA